MLLNTGVFTLSPYLSTYMLAGLQVLLLLSRIWFPKDFMPEHRVLRYFYKLFQDIFLGTYFLFGIISLDTAISWLIGSWVYSDWQFQLPSVLLALVIAPQYIIGVGFKKPRVSQLILGLVTVGVIIYLFHFVTPTTGSMIDSFAFVFILLNVISIIYGIAVDLLDIIAHKRITSINKAADENYLWDISAKFNNFYSIKVNAFLTVIIAGEAMLKIMGSSLFIWF